MIHPDVCRRFEARVASLEAAIRNHHLAWKLRNGKRNEEIRANFDGEKQKFIFN